MYRSNDVLQFDKSFIYLRPFVKVGEPSESVKVFKYYVEKTKQDLNKVLRFEENGPDKSSVDRYNSSAPMYKRNLPENFVNSK